MTFFNNLEAWFFMLLLSKIRGILFVVYVCVPGVSLNCWTYFVGRTFQIYQNYMILNLTTLVQTMNNIWASTRENLSSGVCEQQRRTSACASGQSDQCLYYSESIVSKLATSEISFFS